MSSKNKSKGSKEDKARQDEHRKRTLDAMKKPGSKYV
jgi:hypothetical protein